MELLNEFWASLTLWRIIAAVAVFLVTLLASALIVGIVIVKIPENYFSSHYQEDFLPNASWFTRWGVVIGKNILGVS
jgi:hypothetical protein